MASTTTKTGVILTGVREIDEKLGGGIPIGSLGLIEGQSDAGKSVLSQHLVYGALRSPENGVVYYTTENSVRVLIAQRDSLQGIDGGTFVHKIILGETSGPLNTPLGCFRIKC